MQIHWKRPKNGKIDSLEKYEDHVGDEMWAMDFFDPETEGMVKATEMVKVFAKSRGVREEDLSLPSRAIVTFSRRMLNDLVQVTGANRFEAWRGRNSSLFLTLSAPHPVAMTVSPCGAPGAAILLEELIAFGVERVVFMGYCGSIQDGVGLGEIVLPTHAVREEGTSYHYLPTGARSRPDRMLYHSLHQRLQQRGLPAIRGGVWTTDALYRETEKKIGRYRAEGVLAVDMEMAALFAVGTVRRVGVVGLLLVSDQFSPGAWTPGFFHPLLLKRERVINRILLEWVGGLV